MSECKFESTHIRTCTYSYTSPIFNIELYLYLVIVIVIFIINQYDV